MPYTKDFSDRINQVRHQIAAADYILIGAGAGLSAAAGLTYSGESFEQEFREWIYRYGITDLYSSSFYPFKTEEEKWAYWARHIWFARYRLGGTVLYRELLRLVEHKEYFVLTTNVDAQFEKSGFSRERVFATQGDYAYLQAWSGRPKTLVYNEQWVKEALAATVDCRIPTELIPHHPETGELMSPNLRCDNTFVEDDHWHRQFCRYQDFINKAQDKRLMLLELGVGFNTPAIIRFPFERLAARFPNISLIRFNRDYPQLMIKGVRHFISFTEELPMIISLLQNV